MPWLDADMLGALAAIGGVLMTGLALLGGAIKWVDARQQARAREQREQLQQMAETLARADHQLHPNSGSSLADSIHRIEAEQARQSVQIERIEQRMEHGDDQVRGELDRLSQAAVREHRSLWDAITGRP